MIAVCAVGSCVFILSAQDCISQVSGYAAPTDILDPPTEQTRSDSALCDGAAHAANTLNYCFMAILALFFYPPHIVGGDQNKPY